MIPSQTHTHKKKHLICSGIPRSQPKQMGELRECMGACRGGGGVVPRATPSVSTIFPVQSESARVHLFPPPFSPVAQRYEWGRVTFLRSSLSPNCYREEWVNFFLISFSIVPVSQIKALSLLPFVLQIPFVPTKVKWNLKKKKKGDFLILKDCKVSLF